MSSLRVITDDQVLSALSWHRLIAVMEETFRLIGAGGVNQLAKQIVRVPRTTSYLAVLPAAGRALGAKVVTLFPQNRKSRRPTVSSLILLFDIEDGTPLAVIDAKSLTAWRTAAVSAVAVRVLAPTGAKCLGVLGSGVQARHHVDALRSIVHFEDIRIWSRTRKHAQKFADEFGITATSAEDAVKHADVVVTATHSEEPILKGRWLKHGALVVAVGWASTNSRELDGMAMANQVLVDSRNAALAESGSLRASSVPVLGELSEVITQKVRVDHDRTKIFISVGTAITDIAAAQFVYDCIASP